jgi:hypothetical protein
MTKKFQSYALVSLLSASTMTYMGCSSSDSTTQATAGTAQGSTPNAVQNTNATADSFQPKIVESTDSAPQQTVAVFLDSLRRGDETTANSMLTMLARAEVQKTEYAIQPLGTPEGEFKIGRLGFPYQDQTVALVESQWREPATKTDPELTMDIVCEVHQEGTAWRIAGMAVTVAGESEPLVIDFEDGQRLQQQLRFANGQSTQPVQPTAVPGQQTFSLPNLNQPVQAQVGQPPNQPNFPQPNFQPAGFQQPNFQQPNFQQSGTPQPGVQQPNFQQPAPQQPAPQQPAPQQPELNLNNLPPLPSFPSDNGNQTATPPSGNVLR